MKNSALVLGGHVNGYSIINELNEDKSINILLMDYGHSIAKYSNKVTYVGGIPSADELFIKRVMELRDSYGKLVIYPTDDAQLELLHRTYKALSLACYIPINHGNLIKSLDKSFQYELCEEIGVPYPKSINLNAVEDLKLSHKLMYPLLIKPVTRQDLTINVFRNAFIEQERDWVSIRKELEGFIEQGVTFMLSEFVPGDDTNIYAYTSVQDRQSNVINEWIGKKLTQYPNEYGVCCSASNKAPIIVAEQGRRLVEKMKNIGITEPEFKYDERDDSFKLMETNLRSMMWHRVGSASGVKLHLTQYYLATEPYKVAKYQQNMSDSTHLVLMLHEIPNLIARKGYFKQFKANIKCDGKRVWAIYNPDDLKPFFVSLPLLTKMMISACLRRLNLR
ncbi:hypothetical protein CJF42_10190 [Pseudoalteromonas sp. NBT06-2]|uniref:hypothetical protein n=1 Tax=Pseudoalteromonas sp. NBT06-2 TaxID=2025950 RepID=UPI000BA646C5|nr:hypothetical protein [Pseudoalteromonas sp. NBT06-2]PAJ74473.1 hypothetical protein CJF42_10190 [Pseudoalteromonas sp. NBT06-2]